MGETAWCHKRHASWCERGSCNSPYSITISVFAAKGAQGGRREVLGCLRQVWSVQQTNRPARADSRSLQEDGWFKTSSTATIWMAASRVRRSRTVFRSDRSLQAARMESAWRGDRGNVLQLKDGTNRSARREWLARSKCHSAERECACRGAIRLPDEQSEEPCEARSQEAAREPCWSEFVNLPKRAVSESKLGTPPRGGERKESSFPQQQPIFTGGKLSLNLNSAVEDLDIAA